MRWMIGLLLLANLAVFIWGWSRDQPSEPPLPPLPTAPGQIHLFGEPDEPGPATEATQ
ncbi:hypothetical protein [uncultured Thiodictyon sp.]|uniref:hypothetical protein n=1 Tax=uncultured Thiodictyon sp. TaxID=1846217 RepID=UPI0025D1F164|nr:hypothetical protein [uncultured Thiodictyon sp.]